VNLNGKCQFHWRIVQAAKFSAEGGLKEALAIISCCVNQTGLWDDRCGVQMLPGVAGSSGSSMSTVAITGWDFCWDIRNGILMGL